MTPALYVHIPFCAKKCAYCDFVSYPGRLDEADEYISCMLREAEARKREYEIEGICSLYLGGGTPSLLSAKQLEKLTKELFELFPPVSDAEITLEANPGTLKPGFLEAAYEAGFNRLSLGVQAKQFRLLQILGRIHRFDDAVCAVDAARAAGFENISCDVMNELPMQTEQDITETLTTIMALGVQHISCYGLILEEGTPLAKRVAEGGVQMPDEEQASRLQLCAVDALERGGYRRYEISNYALPGYESKHNIVYWTGSDYLGLGCAAHSFMQGERFSNPGLDEYMRGITRVEAYRVDEMGKLEETILLGTRMARGISLEMIAARYGMKAARALTDRALALGGLVSIENGRLCLTKEGFLLHTAIVGELVNAAEGVLQVR